MTFLFRKVTFLFKKVTFLFEKGGSDNQQAEMTLPNAPAYWKYHLMRAIATVSASDPTVYMILNTHHPLLLLYHPLSSSTILTLLKKLSVLLRLVLLPPPPPLPLPLL